MKLHDLRKDLEDKKEELVLIKRNTSCVICMEKPKNSLCLPCKHLCMCEDCCHVSSIDKCPICRNPIDEIIKCFT